jgi:hypothetical protein
MTTAQFLHRFRNRTLVWCDEAGRPAVDQTVATGYIRPPTKRETEIAEIEHALAANPEFERCTSDGTPDPNGTRWQFRRGA